MKTKTFRTLTTNKLVVVILNKARTENTIEMKTTIEIAIIKASRLGFVNFMDIDLISY